LPAENGNENLARAVTEVSERVTLLIREEIELAKAETAAKVKGLAMGLVAFALAAVVGLFALVVALSTLAWGLDSVITSSAGDIWIGFAIVLGLLIAIAVGAVIFGWRKVKVGAPTPTMAIDEAKKIRETVANPEATR
jgi:Putative Actinobacterial Holin-X, holin superfamily III